MTDLQWGNFSDQALTVAGVVYFLALLAHLVEWSSLRKVPVEVPQTSSRRAKVPAGAAAGDGSHVPADGSHVPADEAPATPVDPPSETDEHRIAMFGRLGLLLTLLAAGVHFAGLVGRGMAADPNRVPWGNMYEFTISGAFTVILVYLVVNRKGTLEWLSPLVVGFVLAVLMVAMIWLHAPVAPLMDALLSPWLVIHVVSAVIATGAFTVGGIYSIVYLLKVRAQSRGKDSTTGYLARVPEPEKLDRTAYRIHAFAFPVWTFAVLITGPIWAHEAWSTYWNWDPKEVWAFITWVVYAAYLHARSTAGWRGKKAAYLALVGMATLWFNFIGINYFSTTSQHSYAEGAASSPEVSPPTVVSG